MPLATLALLAVGPAQVDTPLLQIDAPAGVAGFGTFAVSVGDRDADGVPDLAVASRDATLRVFSGATGVAIASHAVPEGAQPLQLLPVDVDGDVELVTIYRHSSWFVGLQAIDPVSGAEHWNRFSNGQPLATPAAEIRAAVRSQATAAADSIVLGLTEQTLLHPAWWRSSIVEFFTGPLLFQHRFDNVAESTGEGLTAIEDLDGNGAGEIVVGSPQIGFGGAFGSVRLNSGFATPVSPLNWTRDGALDGSEFGEALVRIGDVSGDGASDVVAVEAVGPAFTTLRLVALRSSDGATVRTRDFAREAYPGRAHEVEMVPLDDVDADGVEDFAMIAPRVAPVFGQPATPILRVHSGATLEVLYAWTDVLAELAGADPEAVEIAPAGDVDGDGLGDLLVAAPDGPGGGVVAVLRVRAVLGDRGCAAAVPNSSGAVAHVELTGVDTLVSDDLTLVGSQLPAVAFVLPLASLDVASSPVGGGTLCLGGSIVRLNGLLGRSSLAGTVVAPLQVPQWPALYGVLPQASERWHFQLWFRDVIGGAATSNFSDTSAVTLR
ncbi:MAG: hypothetical protein AAFR54_13205 [Planctomycetota bacterium]